MEQQQEPPLFFTLFDSHSLHIHMPSRQSVTTNTESIYHIVPNTSSPFLTTRAIQVSPKKDLLNNHLGCFLIIPNTSNQDTQEAKISLWINTFVGQIAKDTVDLVAKDLLKYLGKEGDYLYINEGEEPIWFTQSYANIFTAYGPDSGVWLPSHDHTPRLIQCSLENGHLVVQELLEWCQNDLLSHSHNVYILVIQNKVRAFFIMGNSPFSHISCSHFYGAVATLVMC
jgi:hypothetical protein